MDNEKIWVEIIQENCINSINRDNKFIVKNTEKENGKLITLNLFYNYLNELEEQKDEFINRGVEEAKKINYEKGNSKYFEDIINHLTGITQFSLSRKYKLTKIKDKIGLTRDNLKILYTFIQSEHIEYFMDVKKDSNTFLRAFIYAYLLKLYEDVKFDQFNEFLKFLRDTPSQYKLKKCKNEINFIIKVMNDFLQIYKETEHKEKAFAALYFICNIILKFDISLIKIFRELCFRIAKMNPDYMIEEKSLKSQIMARNTNYSDIIDSIRNSNIQIDNVFKFILPLVLGVSTKIMICHASSDREINISIENYPGNSSQFNNSKMNIPSLSNAKIILLNLNQQYKILLKKEEKHNFEFGFSHSYLKQFEYLIRRREIENDLKNSKFYPSFSEQLVLTRALSRQISISIDPLINEEKKLKRDQYAKNPPENYSGNLNNNRMGNFLNKDNEEIKKVKLDNIENKFIDEPKIEENEKELNNVAEENKAFNIPQFQKQGI